MSSGFPHLFDASRFISSSGGVAGGTVYFYYTGTTNPAPIYSDIGLTVPATNPITVAVGAIVPVVYLDPTVTYRRRIVFTDSSVQDVDPIALTSSATLTFNHNVSYPAGSVGSVLNSLRFITNAPYLASENGTTDDSTAVQSAATAGLFFIREGTTRTNTAISGDFSAITFGSTFTGARPLDESYPAFGLTPLKVFTKGAMNAIVGIAHNTRPAATLAFPTGLTGYGRNDNAGNTAFGIYGEARQYANTGCVSNEIDSFNHGAAPSGNLPPNRAIGTPQQHPVALTVGAGGSANSSIGIHICQEGSSPQKFLTGIYVDYNAIQSFGLFVDAVSTSSFTSAVVKHSVNTIGLSLIGEGTPVAGNAAMTYSDGNGVTRFALRQNGSLDLQSATAVVAVNGTPVLGARNTGWAVMSGTSDKSTAYNTNTITLAQLAGRVMALQSALTTHGIIGA